MRATASVVVPFPRTASGDRLELGRLVPSGRSLADRVRRARRDPLAVLAARETPLFGVRTIEVTGAAPRSQRQVRRALDGRSGREPLRRRPRRGDRTSSSAPDRRARSPSTAPTRTRCASPSCPSAPSRSSGRAPTRSRLRARPRDGARRAHRAGPGSRASGSDGRASSSRRVRRRASCGPPSGRWRRSPARVPEPRRLGRDDRRAHAAAAVGSRAAARGHDATSISSSPSPAACSRCSPRAPSTSTSSVPRPAGRGLDNPRLSSRG